MASISPERRARLDREKQKNASGNAKYFSMKNTPKAVIRLIPLGDDDDVAHKLTTYYLNNKYYVDPEVTLGKPGVINRACRALKRLDTIPEAADIAKGIEENRKTRYLMKIIDRANPMDPKWYEAPRAIYEPIFKMFDEDGEDLSHPKEGRDIRVSKTGSGLGTEYSARPLDKSLLLPTVEERKALRAAAADLRVEDELATDESGALQALQDVIPRNIWNLIKAEVTKDLDLGASAASGDEEDAATGATGDDEEDAPPAKPAAKAAAAPAAKSKAAPAPAAAEDDDEGATAAAGSSDDDDDAPVSPVKPAAAKASPAATKAAPAREDRYRAPAAAAAAAATDEDEAAPPAKAPAKAAASPAAKAPAKAAPVASDDDEDA